MCNSDRVNERRKRLAEAYGIVVKQQQQQQQQQQAAYTAPPSGARSRVMTGPDFEEGPHSALTEEEFFDAVELAYDEEAAQDEAKVEAEEKMRERTNSSAGQAAAAEVMVVHVCVSCRHAGNGGCRCRWGKALCCCMHIPPETMWTIAYAA